MNIELFQRYLGEGRFEDILQMAEGDIAAGKANWNTWHCKGFAHRMLGQYTDAITAQEKAVQINPTEPTSLMSLGVARQMNGDYEGALTEFRKVHSINPHHHGAFNSAALTFEKMGDAGRAAELYASALQALIITLVEKLENSNAAPYVPSSVLIGQEWLELVMKPAIDGALEAGVKAISMPTSEMADSEAIAQEYGGLYWYDGVQDGESYRLFLPNFFQTTCLMLQQNREYPLYAKNLAHALSSNGEEDEAERWLAESTAFTHA